MKFVGLWTVHGYTVHWKKSTFAATVHWTVAVLLQKRVKTKKKKKKEQNANVVYETWIQTEALSVKKGKKPIRERDSEKPITICEGNKV